MENFLFSNQVCLSEINCIFMLILLSGSLVGRFLCTPAYLESYIVYILEFDLSSEHIYILLQEVLPVISTRLEWQCYINDLVLYTCDISCLVGLLSHLAFLL